MLAWQAPWLAAHAFHKPQAAELIRLVSLALPALALTRVAVGTLQGLGLMGYAAWVNPLRVLATVLVTVPLLALGFGARGVALAFVPPAWAALAVSLALLVRALPNAFLPSPSTWRARRMLAFSLPQTLTTMLLQTILWTDMLLLGRLRTAAEVAVYTIAQRLLSPAQIISTATGQMFAPRIAAEDARGDRENLGRMLKRVTYWNLAASIPVFALLLVLPGPAPASVRQRVLDGRDRARDPRRRAALQRRDGTARPGDQHVGASVRHARQQRGRRRAQRRGLPDPDPALRHRRRRVLDDRRGHDRQRRQARSRCR